MEGLFVFAALSHRAWQPRALSRFIPIESGETHGAQRTMTARYSSSLAWRFPIKATGVRNGRVSPATRKGGREEGRVHGRIVVAWGSKVEL
jgi:hypothetical protein